MKFFLILFIFFFNFSDLKSQTNKMILDNLQNPGITAQGQRWSFFTDGVMGGLSKGKAEITEIDNVACYRMTGNVTTENNGGFIQIRTLINPEIDAANHDGIYLKVYGNNKKYSLHIRTPITLAPWQYYSYKFEAKNNWMEIKAPFTKFEKSNFYQPKKLPNQKLKAIGLVAGFDNFKADVCLAEIGFY